MVGSSFWANAQTRVVLKEYVVSQTTFFQLFFPSDTTSLEFKQNFQDEINILSSTYRDVWSATDSLYDNATHYSYDVTGNVKTLVQDIKELNAYNQRFKRIDYNYDQLSGKVNAVFYQKDSVDQFTHRYVYDADNRLSIVYTSQQLAYYSPASAPYVNCK